jgi:histidyl-tRNA synthetase
MVAVWNEDDRPAANAIANQLRSRGIAADVAPTAAKLGKQIKYADKLGIPYVWFPNGANDEAGAPDEVKNIVTGDQEQADAATWNPAEDYAAQGVVLGKE